MPDQSTSTDIVPHSQPGPGSTRTLMGWRPPQELQLPPPRSLSQEGDIDRSITTALIVVAIISFGAALLSILVQPVCAWIFGGVGFLSFPVSYWISRLDGASLREERWLLTNGIPAPGVILRHNVSAPPNKAAETWQYSFTAGSGQTIIGTWRSSGRYPVRLRRRQVTVLYDPSNPNRNIIYTGSMTR